MRRGTIVVVVFIILALGIVGASQFLRSQPPVEISVVVSPLAEAWVRSAAESFNASSPVVNATRRVQVRVSAQDDLSIWSDEGLRQWQDAPPTIWIPASSTSVDYANRLPFEIIEPSLAKTLLVWGGFSDRVDALTDAGARPLDWTDVASAAEAGRWANIDGAQASWGNVNLAFSRPNGSISGLAAMLSGAAAFQQDATLSGATVVGSEFQSRMRPILMSVPNANTLGASVAQTLASRGVSVGAVALLPESEWISSLTGNLAAAANPIRLSYPAYPFVFDFPLARQSGLPADENAAVEAFRNWLNNQSREDFGLRPPVGVVEVAAAGRFAAAQDYGAQLAPDLSQAITPPPRAETLRLLLWVSSIIR